MDKEEFNKLNIEEQIKIFNSGIKKYGSSAAVSRTLGYKDESTIRKRFRNKEYKLNDQKTAYILINKSETKVKKKNQAVVANNSASIKTKNKSETLVKNTKKESNNNSETLTNEDLKELLAVKDDILAVVKLYKKNTIACDVSNEIKIDTDRIKDEAAITKGLKTYPSVITEFKEFCNNHKEYRMQDLIAMAFLEYIKKYD